MSKCALIVSVFACASVTAANTYARDLAEIESQVNELSSQLEQIANKSVTPKKYRKGWIPIPGMETDLRFYGMARAQLIYNVDSGFGSSQTVIGPFNNAYGGVAYDGTPQSNRSGQVEFDARASRLGFETITATDYGDVRVLVETDFYGSGGSKLSSNSVGLRLRHAIFEVGPWLVGQYWSNFPDLGAAPYLMDFGGPVGLPAASRLPQIRYTQKPAENHSVSVSIEQPVQDFAGADTVLFQSGFNNISENSIDETPELVGRYTFSNGWMRQSFAGAGRKLTYDTGNSGERDSAYGYAFTYQGKFSTVGNSNVYYSATFADGASRYITHQTTSSAVLYNNSLYRIKGKAFNIGYTQAWNPRWTSTFNVGMNEYDIPKETPQYGPTMSGSKSFFTNLMWKPIPKALIGIEYQYAEIEDDNGREGSGQRLYLTAMMNF